MYCSTRTEPKHARILLSVTMKQFAFGPDIYCLLMCGGVVDTGGRTLMA